MKENDSKLIKDLIKLEIKPVPNDNFTADTIKKIRILNSEKLALSHSKETFIFLPVKGYASIFILFIISKIAAAIMPLIFYKYLTLFNDFIYAIILSPVTISIVLSFLILYYLDLYLIRKIDWRFTKPNNAYSK